MIRLAFFVFVLTLAACSDPKPIAPHPAGKANCDLCEFLGDDNYTIAEGQGAHESPPPDSLFILFEDSNLESVVRQALDRPQGRFTSEDIDSLTHISASSKDIHRLAGLEHLTALQRLDLQDNLIADITPLVALAKLDSLDLQDNLIVDVTPLTGLTRLSLLDLKNNLIQDVAPLVANTGLGEGDQVNLENNPLSTQALGEQIPVLEARGVEVQYTIDDAQDAIDDEQDTDTSSNNSSILFPDSTLEKVVRQVLRRPRGPLTPENVASLTKIVAGQTNIRNLMGIEKLTNLEFLWLAECQISDITPLATLPNLDLLLLSGNLISDITPLATLPNLTYLWLSDNQIFDVTPLATLTDLRYLSLGSNQISDVIPLATLTNLEELSLSNNPISDITPLAKLTNLKDLSLFSNPISDITPLAKLTNIETLDLDYNNRLTDITPLATLTNLIRLSLSNNPISNITPLAKLTNIEDLYLADNQIKDLAPLVANTGLGEGDQVNLENNPLSAQALNRQIPALQARGVIVTY